MSRFLLTFPRTTRLWLLCLLFAGSRAPAATNLISNGTFDGTTASWTLQQTVPVTGDAAILTDTGGEMPAVFQTVPLPSQLLAFTVGFDFLNALSPNVAPGKLKDTFFASLYFGSTAFGATLPGTFTANLDLMDLDSTGASNAPAAATFTSSPRGAGWTHFELTAAPPAGFTGPGFATVAFQFFELNGLPGDSTAAVDNVFFSVTNVPEPAGLALMASGLLLAASTRRQRPR